MNTRGFHVYAALEGSLGLEAIREALPAGTPVRAVTLAEAGRAGSEIQQGADLVIVGCSQSHAQALDVISAATAQRADRPVVVLYHGTPNGFLEQAFEAGADDLIALPQSAGQLGFALEKALARRRGAGASADEGAMITVLGPKGGTGKTVTSSNLAVALALAGKSAVLVDLDLQFGDVGLALGLEPKRTIYDLATSGGSLDADKIDGFLAEHPSGARALLAPLRPDQAAAVGTSFLREVFEILRSRYEFVIADTPPAFTPEVIAAVDASSQLCMVGMLDALSLKDTKIGLETLEQMGYDPTTVTLVLNRADSSVGITQRRRGAAAGAGTRRARRQRPRDSPRTDERPADRGGRAEVEGCAVVHDLGGAFPGGGGAAGRDHSGPGRGGTDQQRTAALAAAEGGLAMELHERIATSPTGATVVESNGGGNDPFAELKNRIHLALVSELGPRLFDVEDSGAVRSRVESEIDDQLDHETGLSREDRRRLGAEIADDIFGYGPLERLLSDPTISEIMVNGPKDIWIERAGRLSQTTLTFTDASHLRRIITKMVGQIGRRIDESSPLVDARLPDGSRVNAIIPPLSLSGPLLTIRKFAQNRFGMSELIELGTLSNEAAEFLQNCIKARLNVLISGGTGSGKTTFLNALSAAVPDTDRIVTIEDAAELQLDQQHVLRLESRPKNIEGEGEITIRDLVRNALRMRPDRIIVGEVRGAEALDMLQAMNTGHEGSLSTVHANSPRDALNRVETMVLMAGYELPLRAIRSHVSSALDLVVQARPAR